MKNIKLLRLPGCIATLMIFMTTIAWSKVKENATPLDTNTTTDYSVSTHWLSLPVSLKKADVFYVYPTVWYKTAAYHPDVCAVDYPDMMLGAQNAYAWQATAFEAAGNVYAHFYRQMDAGSTRTPGLT